MATRPPDRKTQQGSRTLARPIVRLAVRLTPRAGRDRIVGWARDEAGRAYLAVKVAAAPVDGQANAALVRLIAQALRRPARAVRIASGETARLKQIEIDGAADAEITAAFGVAP